MSSEEGQFDIKIFSPPISPKIIDDIEEQTLCPLSCVRELESKWVLEFDLPLVNKKSITVSLQSGNVVSVEAKLKEAYLDLDLDYKREFKYFKKSITIPGKIDSKKITANFTNGRLTIQIPKFFRGHKIKIK